MLRHVGKARRLACADNRYSQRPHGRLESVRARISLLLACPVEPRPLWQPVPVQEVF